MSGPVAHILHSTATVTDPLQLLHRKEGVTQGDPVVMIINGIRVLPLIRELWDGHPCITDTWYDDDSSAEGTFKPIPAHFQDLQSWGTLRG